MTRKTIPYSNLRLLSILGLICVLLVSLMVVGACGDDEEEPAVTEYTLTIAVTPTGGGTTSPAAGTHTYDEDTVVTVTATAASGYVFDKWSGASTATTATTTVTMTSNKTVTANFEVETPTVTEYTLTMAVDPADSGTTSPAVGTHDYDDGTVVDITATAATGYQFDDWTGDVADATAASTTVTMDANQTVTATFSALGNLTLTMAVSGSGTTTPAAGAHSYACGTVVDITAVAAEDWQFVNWTTDGDIAEIADPTSDTTTVTVDADKTVTANFGFEPAATWTKYDVTVNATVGDPPTGGSWSDLELCSDQDASPDTTTYDGTTVFELWVSEETFTDGEGETYHLTKIPQESFSSATTCMSLPALGSELATVTTLEADVAGRLYTSSGALVDFRSETDDLGSVNTYSNVVTTDSTGHYISTTPFHTVAQTYIIGAMGTECRDPDPETDQLIATTILPMMNTTGTAQNTILAGTTVQCIGFGTIDPSPGPGALVEDGEGNLLTGAPMDLGAGTGTLVAVYALLNTYNEVTLQTSDMRSEQTWELTLTPQV